MADVSKLKLTGDKILLQIPPKEETIEGGIIIPETGRSRIADKFKVLVIGPDVSEDIKVGNTIVLDSRNCGLLTKYDGEFFVMAKEPEVACVIEED